MKRFALALCVAAAACAQPAIHIAPANLRPETDLLCLAPDGQAAEWTLQLDRIRGEATGICPAPARFVHIAPCRPGQAPPREGAELWAARARAAGDQSLIGDSFNGIPYCLKPQPR